MKIYTVETTMPKEHAKRVSLKGEGKNSIVLHVSRYSLIGPNDRVVVDAGHPPKISVLSREDETDQIKVAPSFEAVGFSSLGSYQLPHKICEVTRVEDVYALQHLEQFHYKTFEASTSEEKDGKKKGTDTVGGRKAILLCYLKLNESWIPAGYIEIQMPLLMVKPRHDLFANPFTHAKRPISWTEWDLESMRKYVNTIARVARVVVAPDFRGLGLAKALIDAAKAFASERWHVGGRRALFLEISAEMLNYIDFVSSAGFYFVGKTEGNLKRVVEDLMSMRKGQKIGSGIMSLQQKYLRSLERYCSDTGKEFDDVLHRLAQVVDSADPQGSLTPSEWLAFRSVIRFPLPYYLCPLDDSAAAYLESNLSDKARSRRSRSRFRSSNVSIKLRDLRVHTNYQIPGSKYTRLIMDAFGIRGDTIQQSVFGPLDVEASSGNLIFVSGTSGSGKSVLLRSLDPLGTQGQDVLVRTFKGEQKYSVAWLKALPTSTPVFDYFAERYTPEAAFAALSQVGLSEAFVFLKPYELLSRGQKYRAMLADLLLRDDPVWLIDEFCSDLDPLSAKIVSHNLRRHVMRSGRVCFIAAANHSHFIESLKPTAVIVLAISAEPRVVSFKEYRDEFLRKAG